MSAYHDFIRVTGWIGNLAIQIERQFFGRDAPRPDFQGRSIRGLTVEQHHLDLPRERLTALRAGEGLTEHWRYSRGVVGKFDKGLRIPTTLPLCGEEVAIIDM